MRPDPAFFCATLCAALSFAALLSSGRAAAAVEHAERGESAVHIESTTCPHPLVEEVQHLARVELNGSGLPEGEDTPRVILSCAAKVILIRAVLGGEGDSRQLDLAQTDESLRARVIAIAIAELVRDTASGAQQTAAPTPVPALPASVPARAQETVPLLTPTSHFEAVNRLVLFGKLTNFGSDFEPLYGGGLTFSHDWGRFALGVGSELMESERDLALGSVHVLAADLSLRLALRFPSPVLPSEIGIGHALGLTRIKGSSGSADAVANQVSGVWAGPFFFAGFEANLGQPFFLQVAAQLGVVTLPVRGEVDGASNASVSGAWGGLSIGFGLAL